MYRTKSAHEGLSFVPVIAIGFDDLQQRVGAQSQQATAHQEKLKVSDYYTSPVTINPISYFAGTQKSPRISLSTSFPFKRDTPSACLFHSHPTYPSSTLLCNTPPPTHPLCPFVRHPPRRRVPQEYVGRD
jgi:hypothetical protein